MPIREPDHRTDEPCPISTRRRAARIATILCLGALGTLQVACNCTVGGDLMTGKEVICIPEATYDGSSPTHVCMWSLILGGIDEESMAAACAQEANEHYGVFSYGPQDFPNAALALDTNGKTIACDDEHPYWVETLGGEGNDEAADDGTPNPVSNAIECHFAVETVLTDNSTVTPSEDTLEPFVLCGTWPTPAAKANACALACTATTNDLLNDGWTFVSGSCSPTNMIPIDEVSQSCMADMMQGSILAAAAEVTFTDGLNTLTEVGFGAMAYDDSSCVTGVPCEPYVLMTFSLPTTSFAYVDAARLTYDVDATGLVLSTLQPVQAQVDPTSGLLHVDALLLDFTADSVSVDGAPVGPLHLRESVGPLDLTIDPRSGEITLTGTLMRDGAQLDITFVGDPSRPASWPSG